MLFSNIHFSYVITFLENLWPDSSHTNKGVTLCLSKGGVVVWVTSMLVRLFLPIGFIYVELFRTDLKALKLLGTVCVFP